MLTDKRTYMPAMLAVVVVLLIVQQFAVVPGSGRIAGGLQNAAHGPWFALVTYLVWRVVRGRFSPPRALIATALVAFGLALITEALQILTGGDAQWADVAFDMLGACAALTFVAGRTQALPRVASLWTAGCLLLLTLTPAMTALAITAHRNAIFPELVALDAPFYGGLLNANSRIEVVEAPAGWQNPGRVLAIEFADTRWPGVSLPEPVSDWSAFAALEVELFTEREVEMHVSVRLADAPTDHVYRTFQLRGGPARLTLPIAELFDARRARVTDVVIYSTRQYAGQTVYLGRVALVAG